MKNIYYNPEKFGLESFGEVDIYERNWDFHIFAVWKVKETGEFAWAYDSGCSCPSPFESLARDNLEYGNSMEVMAALDECIDEETYSEEANADARVRSLVLATKLVSA